jgi:hypothetical protein
MENERAAAIASEVGICAPFARPIVFATSSGLRLTRYRALLFVDEELRAAGLKLFAPFARLETALPSIVATSRLVPRAPYNATIVLIDAREERDDSVLTISLRIAPTYLDESVADPVLVEALPTDEKTYLSIQKRRNLGTHVFPTIESVRTTHWQWLTRNETTSGVLFLLIHLALSPQAVAADPNPRLFTHHVTLGELATLLEQCTRGTRTGFPTQAQLEMNAELYTAAYQRAIRETRPLRLELDEREEGEQVAQAQVVTEPVPVPELPQVSMSAEDVTAVAATLPASESGSIHVLATATADNVVVQQFMPLPIPRQVEPMSEDEPFPREPELGAEHYPSDFSNSPQHRALLERIVPYADVPGSFRMLVGVWLTHLLALERPLLDERYVLTRAISNLFKRKSLPTLDEYDSTSAVSAQTTLAAAFAEATRAGDRALAQGLVDRAIYSKFRVCSTSAARRPIAEALVYLVLGARDDVSSGTGRELRERLYDELVLALVGPHTTASSFMHIITRLVAFIDATWTSILPALQFPSLIAAHFTSRIAGFINVLYAQLPRFASEVLAQYPIPLRGTFETEVDTSRLEGVRADAVQRRRKINEAIGLERALRAQPFFLQPWEWAVVDWLVATEAHAPGAGAGVNGGIVVLRPSFRKFAILFTAAEALVQDRSVTLIITPQTQLPAWTQFATQQIHRPDILSVHRLPAEGERRIRTPARHTWVCVSWESLSDELIASVASWTPFTRLVVDEFPRYANQKLGQFDALLERARTSAPVFYLAPELARSDVSQVLGLMFERLDNTHGELARVGTRINWRKVDAATLARVQDASYIATYGRVIDEFFRTRRLYTIRLQLSTGEEELYNRALRTIRDNANLNVFQRMRLCMAASAVPLVESAARNLEMSQDDIHFSIELRDCARRNALIERLIQPPESREALVQPVWIVTQFEELVVRDRSTYDFDLEFRPVPIFGRGASVYVDVWVWPYDFGRGVNENPSHGTLLTYDGAATLLASGRRPGTIVLYDNSYDRRLEDLLFRQVQAAMASMDARAIVSVIDMEAGETLEQTFVSPVRAAVNEEWDTPTNDEEDFEGVLEPLSLAPRRFVRALTDLTA